MNKVMTLHDAVAKYVENGDTLTVFVYPTLKALVPSVKLCNGDSVGALCID